MTTFKGNIATERGKLLEEPVRKIIEIRLGEDLEELIAQSIEFPWIVAQIDGYGPTQQVEIKCPFNGVSFAKMAQEIPLHYKYQLQHQMLVTGRKACVFAVYYKGELVLTPYAACPVMQSACIESSRQFLEDLKQARQASETQNNLHESA